MQVIALETGMLAVNCYIVYCEETCQCCVIDPGGDAEKILKQAETHGLSIQSILLTHGHFDHIGGVKELKERTGASVAIHSEDAAQLTDSRLNLSVLMGLDAVQTKPDVILQDGDSISLGKCTMTVIHTPGHTPGSVCFQTKTALFTGDTLFAGSVGRTDLPGGDGRRLTDSIQNRLLTLGEDYVLYPGHGGSTTLQSERDTNPYLR